MTANPKADPLSLCTFQVSVFSREALLSTASGFAVQVGVERFLVTNWHVVSGQHPRTGELLAQHGHPPQNIVFRLHPRGRGTPTLGMPLTDEDGRPTWLEHPDLGKRLDVVALRVPEAVPEDQMVPLRPEESIADMAVWPGMEAAIVGFPLGYSGPATLPIWKTGHIANDLSMDCPEGPCFYIDATTRGGMSGSPVFLSQLHGYHIEGTRNYNLVTGRRAYRWLGVYSGRIHDDAEVGIVWKTDAVMELLRNGVRPR